MSFNPRLLKCGPQTRNQLRMGNCFISPPQVFVVDGMWIHLLFVPGLTVLKDTTIMLPPPPPFKPSKGLFMPKRSHINSSERDFPKKPPPVDSSQWMVLLDSGLWRKRFNSGTKDSLTHSELCEDFIKVTGIKKASRKRQWKGAGEYLPH